MLLPIVINALMAATYPLAKAANSITQPIFLTGVRMVLAGIIILLYQALRNKPKVLRINYYEWPYLLQLCLFNIFITNILQFWALEYMPAAKAFFIYSLTPFFSSIISYFVFGERMTWLKALGLVIGFGGFIPLFMSTSVSSEMASGGLGFMTWPELALLAASIASVWGWTVMKKIQEHHVANMVTANGFSMLFGGLLFFPSSALMGENWSALVTGSWWLFFAYLLGLVVANNFIAYNGFVFLLRRYSTTLLFFIGFSGPLFTALYSWLFLGEPITWPLYVAAAGVIIGLSLYYREDKRLGYVKGSRAQHNTAH